MCGVEAKFKAFLRRTDVDAFWKHRVGEQVGRNDDKGLHLPMLVEFTERSEAKMEGGAGLPGATWVLCTELCSAPRLVCRGRLRVEGVAIECSSGSDSPPRRAQDRTTRAKTR